MSQTVSPAEASERKVDLLEVRDLRVFYERLRASTSCLRTAAPRAPFASEARS
jgi:hypothetical protein